MSISTVKDTNFRFLVIPYRDTNSRQASRVRDISPKRHKYPAQERFCSKEKTQEADDRTIFIKSKRHKNPVISYFRCVLCSKKTQNPGENDARRLTRCCVHQMMRAVSTKPQSAMVIEGEIQHEKGAAPDAIESGAALVTARRPYHLADSYVNKSNALVQASFRLTLNEQRLILACIAKLDSRRIGTRPGYDQISGIRITALEFAETFKISTKDAYAALKEASNHLYERSIQTFDGKKKGRFRWIYKQADYLDGAGAVEISFTPDVAQYLTLLRNQFTSFRLRQIAELRSVYSIRLFEFLMQFRQTGYLCLLLEDLIKRLQLPYDRWVHIRQRVIEPAVQEICAKSNLDIKWQPKKTGRSVTAVEFWFSESAQGKLPLGDDLSSEEMLFPDAEVTAPPS